MARRKVRRKRSSGSGSGHGGGGVLQGMRGAFRRVAGAEQGGPSSDRKSRLWNVITWIALAAALGYVVYRYTQ